MKPHATNDNRRATLSVTATEGDQHQRRSSLQRVRIDNRRQPPAFLYEDGQKLHPPSETYGSQITEEEARDPSELAPTTQRKQRRRSTGDERNATIQQGTRRATQQDTHLADDDSAEETNAVVLRFLFLGEGDEGALASSSPILGEDIR